MGIEFALCAVLNAGIAIILAFEYFAQTPQNIADALKDPSNRPLLILFGLCAAVGNIIVWIPALCGF